MEDSNPEDSNPGTPSAPAQFDNDDAIDAKIAAIESTIEKLIRDKSAKASAQTTSGLEGLDEKLSSPDVAGKLFHDDENPAAAFASSASKTNTLETAIASKMEHQVSNSESADHNIESAGSELSAESLAGNIRDILLTDSPALKCANIDCPCEQRYDADGGVVFDYCCRTCSLGAACDGNVHYKNWHLYGDGGNDSKPQEVPLPPTPNSAYSISNESDGIMKRTSSVSDRDGVDVHDVPAQPLANHPVVKKILEGPNDVVHGPMAELKEAGQGVNLGDNDDGGGVGLGMSTHTKVLPVHTLIAGSNNEKIMLHVAPNSSIGTVKAMLADLTSIPVERQQLMLRGTGSIMMNDWRLDMMHYPTVWNDGVVLMTITPCDTSEVTSSQAWTAPSAKFDSNSIDERHPNNLHIAKTGVNIRNNVLLPPATTAPTFGSPGDIGPSVLDQDIDLDEEIEADFNLEFGRRLTVQFESTEFQLAAQDTELMLSSEAFIKICADNDINITQDFAQLIEQIITQAQECTMMATESNMTVRESTQALMDLQQTVLHNCTSQFWTSMQHVLFTQVLPVVKIQWEADQTANAVDSGIDIPCLATLKVTLTLLSRNKGQRAVIQKDINNKNKMCELIKLDVIKITSSEPSMLIKYPTAALLKTRKDFLLSKLDGILKDIATLRSFQANYQNETAEHFASHYQIPQLMSAERRVDPKGYNVPATLMVERGQKPDQKLAEEFIAATRTFMLGFPASFDTLIPMMFAIIDTVTQGTFTWFPPDQNDDGSFSELPITSDLRVVYQAQNNAFYDILLAKQSRLVLSTHRSATVGGVFSKNKRKQFSSSKGDGMRTFLLIIMKHYSTSYDAQQKTKRQLEHSGHGFTDGSIIDRIALIRKDAIPDGVQHKIQLPFEIVRKNAIALSTRMPELQTITAKYLDFDAPSHETDALHVLDELYGDVVSYLDTWCRGKPEPPALIHMACTEGVALFNASFALTGTTDVHANVAASLVSRKQRDFEEGTGTWVCGQLSCKTIVSDRSQQQTLTWQKANTHLQPMHHRCLCKAHYKELCKNGTIRLEGNHILKATQKQLDDSKRIREKFKAKPGNRASAKAVVAPDLKSEGSTDDFAAWQMAKKAMEDETAKPKPKPAESTNMDRVNAYMAQMKQARSNRAGR